MSDFYIGWSTEMPASNVRVIRRAVILLALSAVVSAATVAVIQQPFAGSKYELFMPRELHGTLRLKPVPFLTLEESGRQLLLVGPGKLGGAQMVRRLEKQAGLPLDGVFVAAQGKLICHNGKTAFEITDAKPFGQTNPAQETEAVPLGLVTLRGEITDPKCLLGVMKPGEGLTHRECAIRCIAGGITPTLRVANAAGDSEYYLLSGSEGEPINDCLLPFVGIGVEMKGRLAQYGDWMLLRIDPATLRKVNRLTLNAPMCHQ